MKPGIHNSLLGQAGEWFVVANLRRRGIHAHGTAKNWPGYDILATSPSGSCAKSIEVKSTSSTASTYAKSLPNKSADYFVLVSQLRAEDAPTAARMGLGAKANPRAFVVSGRSTSRLLRGSALRILRDQEGRYEDAWNAIRIPKERNPDRRRRMTREAGVLFVACHMARSGFATILGSSLGGTGDMMIGIDKSLGDWRKMLYLPWRERRAYSRGRPVLVPVDVMPYRERIRLLSLADFEEASSGTITPSLYTGLVAFVDPTADRPMETLVVLDREFLGRMRRRRAEWSLDELRANYRATERRWAAVA